MFRKSGEPAALNDAVPAVIVRPVTVRTLFVAALLTLAVVAAVMLLRLVGDTILLLLVAIVFAEGLRPMVVLVERSRLPKVAAILVVYIFLLAVLSGIVVLLVQPVVSEVQSLIANFPGYQHSITDNMQKAETSLHLNVDLGAQVAGSLNTAKDVLLTIGGYVLSVVVSFVIVLLLGFLWLTSSDRLKGFVVDLFPLRQQDLASDVIREMGFRMGGYLQATALNMVVVGVATGVAATALGLPSPILLGIFAGITGAIPLVGPFVGAVPAVLLALTISPAIAIWTVVVVAVIQLLDANLVVPQVMNRVVALPALAVVIALLVGGALAGIIGALLAIPLAAAGQVALLRVIVPAVHLAQGRADSAFARAATPLTPSLRPSAPTGGGRRRARR